MVEYSIQTFNLRKEFHTRKRIPTFSTLGWAHWIMHLIVSRGSDVRKVVAVNDVNIRVKRGELFGLLGPNGAGKTTLIKCLSTLLVPDGGTALINGYDLTEESDKVKMSISLVGSGAWIGFDWGLNLEENLLFFAKLYGLSKQEAEARIYEALEVVDLSDKRKETPGNLSSGMRQKLLVAKGFLTRAPIMFFDEPTKGLDPASARDVRKYIKEKLNTELKETILLTTHYMQEAESLCDRVAIMHEGRIIACDSPSSLVSKLRTKGIVEIEALNAGPEVVSQIQGLNLVEGVSKTEGVEGSLTGTIRIHTEEADRVIDHVIEIMRRNHARVLAISPSEPTLEDVFMSLTGRGLAE